MSAPPYMVVYIAEWTADVQDLTCEQDGAYWRLVRAMWRAGGKLPNRPDKLARICGLTDDRWAEISADVMVLFKIRGGSISHKRVAQERDRYDAKIEQAKEAGKASQSKRRNKINEKSSTSVEIPLQRKSNQPEPEPEREDTHSLNTRDPDEFSRQNDEAKEAAGDALASMATHPGIASLAMLRPLLAADPPCLWAEDILPAIQAAAAWHRRKAGAGSMTSWTTARYIAIQNRDARLAGAPAPKVEALDDHRTSPGFGALGVPDRSPRGRSGVTDFASIVAARRRGRRDGGAIPE